MKKFILLVLSFISLSACAQNNKNIQDTKTTPDTKNTQDIKKVDSVNTQGFKKYFDECGVQGSFMMYDMKNNKYTYYDSARCYVRYSPASTFKIPNSLIGLET